MNPIQLSTVIQNKRREKGITQEQLAAYSGVSKAAVSKWENGLSYPDVSLLPLLAAYFNISIDELIGYEPQMTKEDIRLLYQRLSRDFARKPFEEVYQECCNAAAKYYSCFPLLLHIGILLLNHAMLCVEEDRRKEVINYARELFIRVRKECQDVPMANKALYTEAYCAMYLGEPQEVLRLLNDSGDNAEDATFSSEALRAQAWGALGNISQAAASLQKGSYISMLNLCSQLAQVLQYYISDDYHFEETLRRMETLVDSFALEKLHPGSMFTNYINIAAFMLQRGEEERCIKYILKYADLCCATSFPLKLCGDEYFDQLEEWIGNFDLGANAPRDEKLIQRDLIEVLTTNPVFASIRERIEIKNTVKRLQEHFGFV